MEKEPTQHKETGKSERALEINKRIAEIDRMIFGLTDNLNLVPAESQESRQGDDDATEAAQTGNTLGEVKSQLERLHREMAELEQELQTLSE